MIKNSIKKAMVIIIGLLVVFSIIFKKILMENYNVSINFFITLFVLVTFIYNVLIPLFEKEINNRAKFIKIFFNITSITFIIITFLLQDMIYFYITLITALISLIIDAIYLKHINFFMWLITISYLIIYFLNY